MFWDDAQLVAKGFKVVILDYDDKRVKGGGMSPCALYAREGELIILHPSTRASRMTALFALIVVIALIGFGVAIYFQVSDELAAIGTAIASALVALWQRRGKVEFDKLAATDISELESKDRITRIYWSNVLGTKTHGKLGIPVIDMGDKKYRLGIIGDDLALALAIVRGEVPPEDDSWAKAALGEVEELE